MEKGCEALLKTWIRQQLPLLLVWTNSYERLTWAPILVLIAHELNAPYALAFAASAYSAANLVGNLVLGAASDRLGPLRVAGASLLFLALTTLLHLEAWSAAALILVRAAHGFFAAAVTPSSFSAASQGTEPAERGRRMARLGLVIALASVVASPVAGRLVGILEVRGTLQMQTAFLLLVGAIGLWAGKGKNEGPAASHSPDVQALDGARWGRREIDPWITLFVCSIGFAAMFGQNTLFYAFPLKATEAGFGPAVVGGMFGLFAIGSVVAFSPPFSRIADRYGRVRPIVAGSLLSAAGMFLLGAGVARESVVLMAVSQLGYGFGFGLVFPAVSAATADGSESERRGMAFGLLTAAFSIGAIVGPLAGQFLDPYLSPFSLAALVMVASLASVRLTRRVAVPALTGPAG
ncbi:MAG TPA: MFS transporter [Limnochordia bacterium]|nr:MFS transporter [Limnochordia bacterium]